MMTSGRARSAAFLAIPAALTIVAGAALLGAHEVVLATVTSTPVGCPGSCDLAAHRSARVGDSSMSGMQMHEDSSTSGMQMQADASMSGTQMQGDASMSEMRMHGGHMLMSPSRPSNAADRARGDRIVAALRVAIAPYHDVRVAEAAGYVAFQPELPLPMVHFTNWRNAMANLYSFDPARPTSIMYERDASGYHLVGAMYTAPRLATLEQLDARVPLSVATWHEHTNLCLPPPGSGRETVFGPGARFGWRVPS